MANSSRSCTLDNHDRELIAASDTIRAVRLVSRDYGSIILIANTCNVESGRP